MKNKSIFKNSIYNVLYKCLNVIFPLITSIYASNILLSEGIGKVASAQNIVLYFTTLASLGIPTYGVKQIAKMRDNRNQLSQTFWELFIINLISSLICCILYYGMIFSISYFQNRLSLYLVCGLSIILNIFNVDWFYQGIEEYRYIMVRSFIIKIISLVLLFALVRTADDYVYYALVSSLALALNYVFNAIHLKNIIVVKKLSFNITQHLRPVFILLWAVIAINVYTLADTTMLTMLCNERTVGLYANSVKIIKIIRDLVVAVAAVLLPRLSYYYSQGDDYSFHKLVDRGLKVLFVLTLPSAIGIVLIANPMVSIMFGKSFAEASLTTRILSFSIISVAFSNFFGYQILVTIGKEKQMMYSTVFGAIINILLNAILIPAYKHNGSAIASVLTEAGVTIYQIICVRKLIRINFNQKFLRSTFISILGMILVVCASKMLILNSLVALIVGVLSGVTTYSSLMLIQKNEMMILFLNKLFRKRVN